MIVLQYYYFARLNFNCIIETGQDHHAKTVSKTHLLMIWESLGYLCLDLTVYTILNGVCGRKGLTEAFGDHEVVLTSSGY